MAGLAFETVSVNPDSVKNSDSEFYLGAGILIFTCAGAFQGSSLSTAAGSVRSAVFASFSSQVR